MTARLLLIAALTLPGWLWAASDGGRSCPRPAPPSDWSPGSLEAWQSRIDRARAEASPDCLPELDLEEGRQRLERGDATRAVDPLADAAAAGAGEPGEAMLLLGRAEGLVLEVPAALRSLAQAQRGWNGSGYDAPAERVRQQAIDDASLLVRLFLRRGGTRWGAYRYDPMWEPSLPDGLRLQSLAGGGGVIAILDRDGGVHSLQGERSGPARVERDAIVAVDARGRILSLDRSGLLRDGTTGIQLDTPRGKLDPSGFTRDLRGRILVVEDGRLVAWAADGKSHVTLPGVEDVEAVAADGRGGVHVLQSGSRVVVVLDPEFRTDHVIANEAGEYRLSGAEAIAADRFGGTYVLDRRGGHIHIFDARGAYVGPVAPPADDREVFRTARAIAVAADGSLYVLVGRRGGTLVRYR